MLPTLRGLCAFELIQAINVPTAEANNYIYSNYVSNHWGMRKEMSFFFFFAVYPKTICNWSGPTQYWIVVEVFIPTGFSAPLGLALVLHRLSSKPFYSHNFKRSNWWFLLLLSQIKTPDKLHTKNYSNKMPDTSWKTPNELIHRLSDAIINCTSVHASVNITSNVNAGRLTSWSIRVHCTAKHCNLWQFKLPCSSTPSHWWLWFPPGAMLEQLAV